MPIGEAATATGGGPVPLTILAGPSLVNALPAIDPHETYDFATASVMAAQLASGGPGDVVASPNTPMLDALYAQGLIEQPVPFTRNRLVIVVPTSNPAQINDIYDLTKPGVSVDVANGSVPVGSFTLTILENMNLTARIFANVVAQESDVRALLTKVVLGQVDAGFVYATDAVAVEGRVKVIKVPAWAQPTLMYSIAITKAANHAAAARFVSEVMSKAGQQKLADFSFLPVVLSQPPARASTK
jgi:molybdate transport system substrate-binding protein